MNPNQHEEDYRRVVDNTGPGRFLTGSNVEIVRERDRLEPPRHVVFDFDGTLSLVRQGWPDVMIPMMVEVLCETGTDETGTDETPEALHDLVREFVMQLNGKQTIYQMIRLAEEVRRRGAVPEEPIEYKRRYHDLLMERVGRRRNALSAGNVSPEEMLVPHSLEMLRQLQARDVQLYLASGTDEHYVVDESRLLGLDEFFGSHIYGAQDDYQNFSKAMVIRRILEESRVDGRSLLGFGDGYVEIQNIKSAGGTAVAVASDETGRSGECDPWKRNRLIGVGADVVIPDYRDCRQLIAWLWNDETTERVDP